MRCRVIVAGWVVVCVLGGCTSDDRPEEPAACADRRETIRADVDGDGRGDVVWRDHVAVGSRTDELVVGVCTSQVSTTVPVGGMGEGEFRAIDIDQDGRSEIVSGGTTVSQGIAEIVVLHGGELVSIPDLHLADGPARFEEVDGQGMPSVIEQWGCEDVDRDGRRDLVLVSATRQPGGATASFEAYRVVGGTARRVGAGSRTLDRLPDANDPVVSTC